MKDLKIAFYLVFIASFLWSLIGLLLPLYLVDIGINGFQLGFLISLLSILGLLVAFPTGIINDKWSIRRAVSIAYILLSVFFFGLSFFDSFSVLMLFFILGGMGKEINKNSIRSFIYKIKTLKNNLSDISLLNLPLNYENQNKAFVTTSSPCLTPFIAFMLSASFFTFCILPLTIITSRHLFLSICM